MTTTPTPTTMDRIPRRSWIAVAACAVYVLMAAGVGNLFSALVDGEHHPVADWLTGTLIPVPIMIIVGLYFAWRSGWWADIWREPSVAVGRPRRWWWLTAPLLSVIATGILYATVPWSELSAGIITVVLVGSICVGIGEELFFRGILLTALRANHSEFFALIVSSVLFGIAHVVGYLVAGLPLGLILFQVAFLSMNGALFYAARRATGKLWAPMVLHGLNDAALFLQTSGRSDQAPDTPASGFIELALIALSVVISISVLRETIRTRRRTRTLAGSV
ncbi:CPBP family intramembrane glutamic endopeptidase [Curtobacterium sp. SP.BCo]|uniref:CPBP family intramembrane glutamic endopeptidase n=1 Tax=Curtobacterium sp. SP.BCo TaxID=3435229 RepID=UPI003F7414F5